MKKTKWFERKFPAIEDNGLLPGIIERLAGTPARLEELTSALNADLQILKPGASWSIKEEAGHLSDLEHLWSGRINDLTGSETEMRAADLSNRKTHNANHNMTEIKVLLNQFREQREALVKQLRNLAEDQLLQSSLHPRLKTPMRVIDLAYFVAEHDDHHLSRITEILTTCTK